MKKRNKNKLMTFELYKGTKQELKFLHDYYKGATYNDIINMTICSIYHFLKEELDKIQELNNSKINESNKA